MFEDAIEDVKKSFEGNKYIGAIVLFGSVARGEATRDSDVDLLIVIKNEKKHERSVSDTMLKIEKKHKIDIQYVTTDKNFDKINRQFLDTILREGIVIFGKMPQIPFQKLGLEPYSLIKYSLSHLPQPEKMRIKRMLLGKETKKTYKGKTYTSKKTGVLMEYGGIKTGIASIMVPEKYSRKIAREMRNHGAKVSIIPAWLQKA